MGEKKTNALSKSMKLIYVYAMATGAIFTFMCYWDGIFMSYTGPGTFLAFALTKYRFMSGIQYGRY